MKKNGRVLLILAVTFTAVYLLLTLGRNPLFNVGIFDKDILNFYAGYEISSILIALAVLVILFFTANKTRLQYLNLKHIDAAMLPVRLMGIKSGERWKITGSIITAVITIVTAAVVYFQVAGNGFHIRLFPDIPLVLLFALMNAFTEEVIFRLPYTTIVANEGLSPKLSEFLGAAVFGAVHYFGMAPKGIAGSIMAAFIGWFLAKSINETKGFFWAWLVHFIQDVVILFLLFSAA